MSDAGECARCNAKLPALAAFCNRCGLIVERKAQFHVPHDLRRLADRHRTLVRVFVVYMVTLALIALQLPNLDPYVALGGGVIGLVLLILLMLAVLSLSDGSSLWRDRLFDSYAPLPRASAQSNDRHLA